MKLAPLVEIHVAFAKLASKAQIIAGIAQSLSANLPESFELSELTGSVLVIKAHPAKISPESDAELAKRRLAAAKLELAQRKLARKRAKARKK